MRQALSSSGVSAGYKLPESFKIKLSEPTMAAVFRRNEDIQTSKKMFVWSGSSAILALQATQIACLEGRVLFVSYAANGVYVSKLFVFLVEPVPGQTKYFSGKALVRCQSTTRNWVSSSIRRSFPALAGISFSHHHT